MDSQHYKLPKRLNTWDGFRRRVGVEIEMSGINLETIVIQVNSAYGGQIEEISPYEFKVRDTSLGDFKVELDFEYLQNYGRERLSEDAKKTGDLEQFANDAVKALAMNVVPCELITPPIPFEKLHHLDDIVTRLRNHNAKGTRHALLFAFGVHLNPELPNLTARTILSYMRAFLCLCDWLIQKEEVSFTRKLLPFIKLFPEEYTAQVLNPDYQPDIAQLIDDYLRHNPTRNRILDMLPLFAHLDKPRVVNIIGDQKLRPRPTLHYRLPNSDIDRPEWSIDQCWNNWQQVELLANDRDRLSEVSSAYLETHKRFSSDFMTQWSERVKPWLIEQ